MKLPDEPSMSDEFTEVDDSHSKPIDIQEVLADLHGGLRTKGFLYKYGLTMPQFEDLLKGLIRRGLFTKEEFRAWKARKSATPPPPSSPPPARLAGPPQPERSGESVGRPINVATYVIHDPEKNNSWTLQLFSTKREQMKGAKFKVSLHGRKYAFEVEELLFRGSVEMLPDPEEIKASAKSKREEAMEFIAQHGWAAYLERRAMAANLGPESSRKSARLVLLHCKNQTFLAALHTPTPAVNLYVGNSIEKIKQRLSKNVDTASLNL
ncbi:MAG: hypothetical protein HY912_14180 [Desulfomonile tiedjei]|uniref:Uncharacterized protein n=1 Tax=Desulfomonile tiedjei TaxID=2358 RepID=A0A9D6Z459_9BACT|nr:hypothetical protein [Desulfomonile tiedjei]